MVQKRRIRRGGRNRTLQPCNSHFFGNRTPNARFTGRVRICEFGVVRVDAAGGGLPPCLLLEFWGDGELGRRGDWRRSGFGVVVWEGRSYGFVGMGMGWGGGEIATFHLRVRWILVVLPLRRGSVFSNRGGRERLRRGWRSGAGCLMRGHAGGMCCLGDGLVDGLGGSAGCCGA